MWKQRKCYCLKYIFFDPAWAWESVPRKDKWVRQEVSSWSLDLRSNQLHSLVHTIVSKGYLCYGSQNMMSFKLAPDWGHRCVPRMVVYGESSKDEAILWFLSVRMIEIADEGKGLGDKHARCPGICSSLTWQEIYRSWGKESLGAWWGSDAKHALLNWQNHLGAHFLQKCL